MHRILNIARNENNVEDFIEQPIADCIFLTSVKSDLNLLANLENEEIGDIEITITTWRSKEDVADWAKDPTHVSAKRKWREWYHWVKGIHIETKDE